MRGWGILFGLVLALPVSAAECRDFLKLFEEVSSPHDPGAGLVEEISRRTRTEVAKNRIPVEPFLKAVDRAGARDPVFKRLNEMFEKQQYSFAIDQNASRRMEILQNGFLNVHETGTSLGVASTEKRNFVEALYLGVEPSRYESVPAAFKPKSMYLVPDPSTGIHLEPTHYVRSPDGTPGDTWVMDLEKIRDHTLFTAGDSLDRALIEGDLLEDIKQFTLDESRRFDGKNIIEHLLPLDWLKTTTPFYYEQVKAKNLFRYVDPAVFKEYYEAQKVAHGGMPMWQESRVNTSRPEFGEAFFKTFPELKKYNEDLLLRPYGNYTEGLYFGRLTPSKIKALIYHGRPPDEAELMALKKAGIRVIKAD